jgi:hypothetical protein
VSRFVRDAVVYGNHFWDFYNAQRKPVQEKIDFVIGLVRAFPRVSEKLFETPGRHGRLVRDARESGDGDLSHLLLFRRRQFGYPAQRFSKKDRQNAAQRNRKSRTTQTTLQCRQYEKIKT